MSNLSRYQLGAIKAKATCALGKPGVEVSPDIVLDLVAAAERGLACSGRHIEPEHDEMLVIERYLND